MNDEFKTNLTTAILSSPIVYIPHFHYLLIDQVLRNILYEDGPHRLFDRTLKQNIVEFDCGRQCVVDFFSKKLDNDMASYNEFEKLLKDVVMLKAVTEPFILILKNCSSYLESLEIQSLLALFAYKYENDAVNRQSTIILMSPRPVTTLPLEFEKYVAVVEMRKPSMDEIMEVVNAYPISQRFSGYRSEVDVKTELCRTLQGLHAYEIKQILYSSLIRTGMKISSKTKQIALEEKKNIVKKSGIIEVVDADENFEQIGGLQILKEDLRKKAAIYKNINEAQRLHVPLPKGVLIIGMPGCGKTMIAKSVAREFDCSLLRLDINRLMGKYVGESESNLRMALATAEAAHPCVLWIDEIEKAFAGTNGQNGDNLVMRLMGHFLTWMQERKTPVFIVATANDVMRPEFMRKGRFDEVYFVDFPKVDERVQILEKTMNVYLNAKDSVFDFSGIQKEDWLDIATEMQVNGKADKDKRDDNKDDEFGFSGSEIKTVVDAVIEKAFEKYVMEKEKNESFKGPVIITKKDFSESVEEIRKSVLAQQLINKDKEKTNIVRISEMGKLYHFKPASK